METSGKTQREMPWFSQVPAPRLASEQFVANASHTGALRLAVQESGCDDYEVADAISISHGYISKVLHGTAGLYGPRLVAFMRRTGSLAPLQWLANQMGCEVVLKDSRAAEVAALRARLNDLEKAA